MIIRCHSLCHIVSVAINLPKRNGILMLIFCRSIIERIPINTIHTLGKVYFLKPCKLVERILRHCRSAFQENYALQALGNVGSVRGMSTRAEDVAEEGVGLTILALADEGDRDRLERIIFTKGSETYNEILSIIRGDSHLLEVCAEEGVGAEVGDRCGESELA